MRFALRTILLVLGVLGGALGPAGAQDLRYLRHQAWTTEDGLPSNSVREIYQTSDGFLWIDTEGGLARFDGLSFEVARAPTHVERSTESSGWRSSNTSVTRTTGPARSWTTGAELPGTRVETLSMDRAGGAWIGTNAGLAFIARGAERAEEIKALRGNIVVQVFEDREGNEWVGTETSGLHVLRPAKFRVEAGLAGLPLTAVVQASDGAVWAGTRRDGLRRMREGSRDEAAAAIPVHPGALTSDFILSLAPGAEGSVWVGTPDGLNHVSANGRVERITSADGLPDDYVLSLAAARDGSVWAGTRHGLVHVTGRKLEVLTKAEGLGGELIGSLLLTSTGDLWIGTAEGVSRRKGSDGEITSFGVNDGLHAGVVSGFAEGSGGTVWIVGDGFGLLCFHDGRFTKVQDAAIPERNDGVIEDGLGFLWLRNEGGIARLRREAVEACLEGEHACMTGASFYEAADGMPSVELAARASAPFWRMADGELWSPTRRGAAIMDPRRMPIDSVVPPVVIEGLVVDGLPVKVGRKPLEIPYGRVRFNVDYAGLSYTAPAGVRYRTRLEGLDRGWTDAGNRRFATYTSLAPGSYVFRVQAMNRDGVWNQAGATLRFRIVPPYYRRWWFLLLLIVGVAGVGAALYRLRLRRLQREFDAVLQERNRMAREIHDTLAQDFVGVTLQLDLISQLLAGGRLEVAKQQLQNTRRLVTEGLAEARRSIWALRANVDEMSLPTRLTKIVERYADQPVKIELRIGGAYRQLAGDVEAEVLRIAQESLSNVSRHSGAGHASVELNYENDRLVLTIEDDGRGFTPSEAMTMEGHFGLRGMEERATVLRATLEITSAPGAGAKVRLTASIAPPRR